MTPSLLILTDFFQAAGRALDYATNLAQPLSARLVLLHVRRDSVLDPETFTGQLSNLSKEAITLALNSVASNLDVPVVAEVGHGRVAYAVADAVSRHHPTLIVLGRPDYSGTPDELVQTTSLDILRVAPYPMLVVPHTVTNAHLPRRVLFAVDGEPFSLGDRTGATRRLLTLLQAQVTVLHVRSGLEDLDATPAAVASVQSTGLVIDLPPLQSRTVVNERPADGILDAARSADYDLVVLIARPRSFLSELFHHSVTAEVMLHCALPVLVLPAQ